MKLKHSLFYSSLLLLAPMLAQAELTAMNDSAMESVSGKGIEIDANVDFAQETSVSYGNLAWGNNATDDTYISYRQVLVDNLGNRLTDSDNDGYINVFGGGANVQKKDALNGYNVLYKKPHAGDKLIRKPAYIMLGEISGGISFTGLKLDFVSDFGYDKSKPITPENKPRPAIKWTLPDKIVFNEFKIDGLYISTDAVIDSSDNKLLGAQLNGPIYLPSATAAYVFVTSD